MLNVLKSRKFFLSFLFISLSLFSLYSFKSSKNKSEKPFVLKGLTMGTYYRISYLPHKNSLLKPQDVKEKIEADLLELNRQMSTYKEDSEISSLNKNEADKELKISPWFMHVLRYSIDLAKKTNGYFDPTVGPLVNLWGFGPGGPQKNPRESEIKRVLATVGFDKILIDSFGVSKKNKEVYLDLSSVAKGFSVDRLSKTLSSLGFENHLVEIGGELKGVGLKNNQEWTIGIEKPQKGRKIHSLISLKNKAIATSGNYRNFSVSEQGVFAHTINPKTGKPVISELVSVTVIDDECMKADALATALVAMGFEKARKFADMHNISALFIFKKEKDFVTESTESFKKYMKDFSLA